MDTEKLHGEEETNESILFNRRMEYNTNDLNIHTKLPKLMYVFHKKEVVFEYLETYVIACVSSHHD